MDPQLAALDGSPYPEAIGVLPPQADVDEFLRKKRKAREHKACYPCRQRKVKCDLSRPCQTCRDREHPELCSYHPPNKRQAVEHGSSGIVRTAVDDETSILGLHSDPGTVTLGRHEFDMLFEKLHGLETSIADLRHELRRNTRESRTSHESDGTSNGEGDVPRPPTHTDIYGIHTKNESGGMVHLGGGSIPAMLYNFSQGQGTSSDQQLQLTDFLGKSFLPLFGLDNESATYPFVDLWGLPHAGLQRARELVKSLPHDAQMLSLFRCYRDMGHVVFPGVADVTQLESDLTMFLIDRAAQSDADAGVTEQNIFGRSYFWLGMLFAVLASGAQCSGMSRKERELTSQVYVCCAFECLRFTNFLSQSHLESIQALIVIGNVMANNMNAGTAWSLLGLTIRLAQGLGLHQKCPPGVTHQHALPRSRVWWAIIWQDSLLSITYDRNAALNVRTMPMPQHFGSVTPYHAAMYRLAKVTVGIIGDRSRSLSLREQVTSITEHRDEIESIMKDAAEYLRDSRKCVSSRQAVEHWALYLHTSFALSELCRPAINPRLSGNESIKPYRQVCIENLVNVIEAFLGLNNITTFTRQSWASVHRGLSSALLLGIIGEHTRNERAQKLILRFVAVMSDLTSSVDPQEISAPVKRGIDALRKLDIDAPQNFQAVEEAFAGALASSIPSDSDAKLEHSQLFTPPNSNSESVPIEAENSPHSVLNNILWGRSTENQNADSNA